jgi:selenocysteine-specific elongation factor
MGPVRQPSGPPGAGQAVHTVPAHAVVGTAGHIDHGKSTLVKALTGIDPDRLAEEKRRGMTIDLGFAHFDLPSGRRVGIVDVPGHERLIRNMLAGATGIDLVLLVIAADEGVMPQTREHLDILRFLRLDRGIVVLNKVDLVEESLGSDWLALVTEDIRGLVAGTFMKGAPIVPVSARTGQGLPALVAAMDQALAEKTPRDVDAPVRIPVDRSFTMPGFGTVVTGTLWTGRVKPGDTLELLPAGRAVRVRNLQSHGQAIPEALAGQRVAANLVGVAKDEIARGDVLVTPGSMQPTTLVDARIRLTAGAPPLPHNARVRVYAGADEVIGRVRLLDRAQLPPGASAPVQVRLERPAVVARGDPFVLRRYSPMTTIGGGEVITVHASLRRRGAGAAEAVDAAAGSAFGDQLRTLLVSAGRSGTTVEVMAQSMASTRERVATQVAAWVGAGEAVDLRGRVFAGEVVRGLGEALVREVGAYHASTPWRRGMPRDELKGRVFDSGDDRLYGHALDGLVAAGRLKVEGGLAALPAFAPSRSAAESGVRAEIEAAFLRARFAPPAREDVLARVADRPAADRMFQSLLDDGVLVNVGGDIVFHRDVLREIEAQIVAQITAHGEITVAGLRDQLGSSRKYTLTLLEYFDAVRLTRRIGDKRILARGVSRA